MKTFTGRDKAALPMGARLMTYECGMRFLMDYIQGDIYLKFTDRGRIWTGKDTV